jgi:hypothetical protein
LLGDKSPVLDTGRNIFLNILGRLPHIGEQVIQLSGTCAISETACGAVQSQPCRRLS